MIFTVSTIRDSIENIERFVNYNSSHGVDHAIIFLDADQPEVVNHFNRNRRVSIIETSRNWWLTGERPDGLNRRQATNASVVNCVLAYMNSHFGLSSWLFHIDGDELLEIEPSELDLISHAQMAVRMPVYEAFSSEQPGANWFKKPISPEQELLGRQLGLIGRAGDEQFFHGHNVKSGVRPDLALRITVHSARLDSGEEPNFAQINRARLLHFESNHFSEFVRKWKNLLSSGPIRGASMRRARREMAQSLEELFALRLEATIEEKFARRLYRNFVLDSNLDELVQLGFVEYIEVDPAVEAPTQLTSSDVADNLSRALSLAAGANKSILRSGPENCRITELNRVMSDF